MGLMGDLTRIAHEVEWARRDIHGLRDDVEREAEGLRESIGEVVEAVGADAEELTSLGTLVEAVAESVADQAVGFEELRTEVQGQKELLNALVEEESRVWRAILPMSEGLLALADRVGGLEEKLSGIKGVLDGLSWVFYSPGGLTLTITGADDMNILFKVACVSPADPVKVSKRVFNLTVGEAAIPLVIESTPDTVLWDGLKGPRNAPAVASLVDYNKIGEPSDAVEVSVVLSVELPERPGALSLTITGAVDDGPDYVPPTPVGKKK